MSETLHVAKTHVIEYSYSGWFNHGQEHLHHLLDDLDIYYSQSDSLFSEYDTDFEISRSGLERGIELLKLVDKCEPVEEVDLDDLTLHLDNASMTLAELIECFEWLLNTAEKKDKEYVHVSFF